MIYKIIKLSLVTVIVFVLALLGFHAVKQGFKYSEEQILSLMEYYLDTHVTIERIGGDFVNEIHIYNAVIYHPKKPDQILLTCPKVIYKFDLYHILTNLGNIKELLGEMDAYNPYLFIDDDILTWSLFANTEGADKSILNQIKVKLHVHHGTVVSQVMSPVAGTNVLSDLNGTWDIQKEDNTIHATAYSYSDNPYVPLSTPIRLWLEITNEFRVFDLHLEMETLELKTPVMPTYSFKDVPLHVTLSWNGFQFNTYRTQEYGLPLKGVQPVGYTNQPNYHRSQGFLFPELYGGGDFLTQNYYVNLPIPSYQPALQSIYDFWVDHLPVESIQSQLNEFNLQFLAQRNHPTGFVYFSKAKETIEYGGTLTTHGVLSPKDSLSFEIRGDSQGFTVPNARYLGTNPKELCFTFDFSYTDFLTYAAIDLDQFRYETYRASTSAIFKRLGSHRYALTLVQPHLEQEYFSKTVALPVPSTYFLIVTHPDKIDILCNGSVDRIITFSAQVSIPWDRPTQIDYYLHFANADIGFINQIQFVSISLEGMWANGVLSGMVDVSNWKRSTVKGMVELFESETVDYDPAQMKHLITVDFDYKPDYGIQIHHAFGMQGKLATRGELLFRGPPEDRISLWHTNIDLWWAGEPFEIHGDFIAKSYRFLGDIYIQHRNHEYHAKGMVALNDRQRIFAKAHIVGLPEDISINGSFGMSPNSLDPYLQITYGPAKILVEGSLKALMDERTFYPALTIGWNNQHWNLKGKIAFDQDSWMHIMPNLTIQGIQGKDSNVPAPIKIAGEVNLEKLEEGSANLKIQYDQYPIHFNGRYRFLQDGIYIFADADINHEVYGIRGRLNWSDRRISPDFKIVWNKQHVIVTGSMEYVALTEGFQWNIKGIYALFSNGSVAKLSGSLDFNDRYIFPNLTLAINEEEKHNLFGRIVFLDQAIQIEALLDNQVDFRGIIQPDLYTFQLIMNRYPSPIPIPIDKSWYASTPGAQSSSSTPEVHYEYPVISNKLSLTIDHSNVLLKGHVKIHDLPLFHPNCQLETRFTYKARLDQLYTKVQINALSIFYADQLLAKFTGELGMDDASQWYWSLKEVQKKASTEGKYNPTTQTIDASLQLDRVYLSFDDTYRIFKPETAFSQTERKLYALVDIVKGLSLDVHVKGNLNNPDVTIRHVSVERMNLINPNPNPRLASSQNLSVTITNLKKTQEAWGVEDLKLQIGGLIVHIKDYVYRFKPKEFDNLIEFITHPFNPLNSFECQYVYAEYKEKDISVVGIVDNIQWKVEQPDSSNPTYILDVRKGSLRVNEYQMYWFNTHLSLGKEWFFDLLGTLELRSKEVHGTVNITIHSENKGNQGIFVAEVTHAYVNNRLLDPFKFSLLFNQDFWYIMANPWNIGGFLTFADGGCYLDLHYNKAGDRSDVRLVGTLFKTDVLDFWNTPMNLQFITHLPSIQFVNVFLDKSLSVDGQLESNLTITGSMINPKVAGVAHLKNGLFQLNQAAFPLKLEQIFITFNFDKQKQASDESAIVQLPLEHIQFKTFKGYVTGEGSLLYQTLWNIYGAHITLNNLNEYSLSLNQIFSFIGYKGEADLKQFTVFFDILGNQIIVGGDILLHDAQLSLYLGKLFSAAPPPTPHSPTPHSKENGAIPASSAIPVKLDRMRLVMGEDVTLQIVQETAIKQRLLQEFFSGLNLVNVLFKTRDRLTENSCTQTDGITLPAFLGTKRVSECKLFDSVILTSDLSQLYSIFVLYGMLQTQSGSINFFHNRLKIEKATITFKGISPSGEPLIYLELRASTLVKDEFDRPTKIAFRYNDYIDKLWSKDYNILDHFSAPAKTKEEVLILLGLQDVSTSIYGQMSADEQEKLKKYQLRNVTGTIETMIIANVVEQFFRWAIGKTLGEHTAYSFGFQLDTNILENYIEKQVFLSEEGQDKGEGYWNETEMSLSYSPKWAPEINLQFGGAFQDDKQVESLLFLPKVAVDWGIDLKHLLEKTFKTEIGDTFESIILDLEAGANLHGQRNAVDPSKTDLLPQGTISLELLFVF